MAPKRAPAKPAKTRAPARPRGRRAPNPSKTLSSKPYTYQFKLPSQSFVSTTVPGQLSVNGGGAPLTPSGTNWTLLPASSGMVNYYDLSFATVFALKDIQNNAIFTAMYDQYKVNRVGLELEYLNTSSLASSSGLMPTVYFYWDRDDVALPSALSAITRRQGVKRRMFGNKSVIQIRTRGKPNMLSVVAGDIAGAQDIAVPMPAKYIDCTQDEIPHYALKGFITDIYLPGATAVQGFRWNWTYDLSFRAPIVTA